MINKCIPLIRMTKCKFIITLSVTIALIALSLNKSTLILNKEQKTKTV